ncbi:MAG: helix-turn-helix transcriptional regulator [Firmicutes bacterium]|nr:helix-turn-helix transcriptional regulator [Bacillota bacterium]
MEFDIRYRSYVFKHSCTDQPDLSQEHFPPHFHTAYELLFFVRGDAYLALQHTQYSIRPGSLLVIKPGEYHNIVFRSEAPYERYVIRVNPISLRRGMAELLSRTQSVYYIAGTPLEEEFYRMDSHLSFLQENTHVNACIGSMDLILSYLINSDSLIQHADYINNDSKRVLDYIDTHLVEVHSIDDLVRGLHMSKSALYRIFSMQLETPPMNYVRTQQCLLAHNLLAEGVPATEVSARLGFSHYSSFYRSYQQVFHASPSEKKVI